MEDGDDVVLTQRCMKGFKVSQIQTAVQSCSVVLGTMRGEGSLAAGSHVNESETSN